MARNAEFERIRREHALLVESIAVTPVPFAVYDEQDRLIAWNEPYERVHRLGFAQLRQVADRRQLHYDDLVRAEARALLPENEVEAHVERLVSLHHRADGHTFDREYPGASWYRISKIRTRSGAVAGLAIDITELKQREQRLEEEIRRRVELEERLRAQMDTDALTRVSSRAAFLARANAEFQRTRATGRQLAMIMMDIDRFKTVNDNHGHGIGDQVLMQIAGAASQAMRCDLDHIGRLGGEEFAVLLPDAGRREAQACAERIRSVIADLRFVDGDVEFTVTASLGVADRADRDADLSALLGRADEALYVAKRGGRNRVALATP